MRAVTERLKRKISSTDTKSDNPDSVSQHTLNICVVVTHATRSAVSSDQVPRNSSLLRPRFLRLSLALALSSLQGTVQCDSGPPNFETEHHGGGQRRPISLSLPSPHERTCGSTAI
ncbi:hypothetical protein TNCV_4513961 [Trichonephila clavipes]|nr:hypothetical protein TNCV_4513961 [Trichonephila clavipes]